MSFTRHLLDLAEAGPRYGLAYGLAFVACWVSLAFLLASTVIAKWLSQEGMLAAHDDVFGGFDGWLGGSLG